MVSYIEQIKPSEVVVVGVQDSAYYKLENSGRNSLKTLGASHSSAYGISHQGSYVLIGSRYTNVPGRGTSGRKTVGNGSVTKNACVLNTLPKDCFKYINVVSGGTGDAEEFSIYVNYEKQTYTASQGFNIFVFDKDTQNVKDKITYDTKDTPSHRTDLTDFLNSITIGDIVAIGVYGSVQNLAGDAISTEIYDLLKDLGADSTLVLNDGNSFALIGQKGIGADNGLVEQKNAGSGGSQAQKCIRGCDSRCKYCYQQSSPDSCTECETGGFKRTATLPNCDCESGFFEENSNVLNCKSCDYPCSSCTGSSSNCTDCQTPTNRKTDSTCGCNPGYFDDTTQCLSCDTVTCKDQLCTTSKYNCDECVDGYVKNGSICSLCTSPCKFCTTNQTTCTSCVDGYYISGNTCPQCPSHYSKCTDNTTPTECKSGTGRLNLTDKCICDNGYFEKGTDDCGQCQSPCKTCTGNQDHCESCIDGWYLTGNICTQCPTHFNKCTNNTTPTECKSGIGRLALIDLCGCDTENGYFEKGTVDCGVCQSPCKTCTGNQDHCDSCIDGYYKVGNSCTLCPFNFSKCNDSNTPTECKSGLGREGIDKNCQCGDGFYEKNTLDCGKCEYPCVKCFGGPKLCIDCNDRFCGTCVENSSTCITPCKSSCSRCDENGDCKTCNVGEYLNTNNKTCESCHPKCELCHQNDKNQCITCQNSNQILNRSRKIEENCSCLQGYYEDQLTLECKKCKTDLCKRCDSEGVCLECLNSDFVAPFCSFTDNKVVEKKEANPDGSDQLIVKNCDKKCSRCQISSGNCLSCSNGDNRLPLPSCICKEGYHDNQGKNEDCEKCPVNCQNCLSADVCIACEQIQGVVLDSFSAQCVCQEGYKANEDGVCQVCYHFEGSCLHVCPVNSEMDKNKQVCVKLEYQISEKYALFYVCGFCLLIFSFVFVVCMVLVQSKKQKQPIISKHRQEQIQA